jgi:ADP-ribosylglycohydrolase
MEKTTGQLLDKTFACLAAAAPGVAMDAPVEGWHYEAVQKKYGVVRDLLADKMLHLLRRGLASYPRTGDTVLRNRLCEPSSRRGGASRRADLRQVWLEELNLAATNLLDTIAFMKLAAGTPARDNGEGFPVCVTAPLGIAPIGIINACGPKSAAEDAFGGACMT